jgi:hypothetical protein
MLETLDPAACFLEALQAARAPATPYKHWRLRHILPAAMLDGITALPVPAPAIADTQGRRETHNSTRWFFGSAAQQQFPVCAALAQTLQSPSVIAALQARCAVNLQGSYLRIEYCQDSNGFWLEPHTDIGAKIFTMLIYLSDSPPGEDWGTDIYVNAQSPAGTIAFRRNQGLIFIPGSNSWHGFAKRPITGVRRSLIVNYVVPDWRARHELCFPGTPVP